MSEFPSYESKLINIFHKLILKYQKDEFAVNIGHKMQTGKTIIFCKS